MERDPPAINKKRIGNVAVILKDQVLHTFRFHRQAHVCDLSAIYVKS